MKRGWGRRGEGERGEVVEARKQGREDKRTDEGDTQEKHRRNAK